MCMCMYKLTCHGTHGSRQTSFLESVLSFHLSRWDLLFLCPWSASDSLFSTSHLAIKVLGLQMHVIVSSFWWILAVELRSSSFCGKWFYSPRNIPKLDFLGAFSLFLGFFFSWLFSPTPSYPPCCPLFISITTINKCRSHPRFQSSWWN